MKLPPVRKRQSYADITTNDLTFALFYDRILGLQAMSPETEQIAPSTKAQTEADMTTGGALVPTGTRKHYRRRRP